MSHHPRIIHIESNSNRILSEINFLRENTQNQLKTGIAVKRLFRHFFMHNRWDITTPVIHTQLMLESGKRDLKAFLCTKNLGHCPHQPYTRKYVVHGGGDIRCS